MDFQTLYAELFPVVYKYLLALCGDPSLAEELTQEAFYRVIEHSDTFRGDCKVSVWLCQIGKNCWLSQLRRQKRQAGGSALDAPADAGDVEEALFRQDTAMELYRRLHSLPEPYREVFSLRVLGELTFCQIGELFGKSENWARVTYYRAKIKLKENFL